jgi:hypothetical protein
MRRSGERNFPGLQQVGQSLPPLCLITPPDKPNCDVQICVAKLPFGARPCLVFSRLARPSLQPDCPLCANSGHSASFPLGVAIQTDRARECPLWVKSRYLQRKKASPLCARSGHLSLRVTDATLFRCEISQLRFYRNTSPQSHLWQEGHMTAELSSPAKAWI